ncbi:RNA helicase [Malassezia psittaci]|uniref:RNA helicase n=1 Tax=Malassezia psittaci TaxID=1821823 RepID=A0AAF0F901_9BASI|nr:RNA helicase [Malassezia psittaci]
MVKNQPVKRYDGEPLTRKDVQHAMLCYLFADTRRVFTNPRAGSRGAATSTFASSLSESSHAESEKGNVANQPPAVQLQIAQAISGPFPTPVWPYGQSAGSARRSDESSEEITEWEKRRSAYCDWRNANFPASVTPIAELENPDMEWEHPGAEKLTFKELYIEALINSSKCTRSMREKCLLDEEYAEDFSKVCLLVNVGRINTTLAFYPEMKTILRSYHPVPSLQKSDNTRRNMQDAPRMKSLLKAVLLPFERPGPPGGTATSSASAKHNSDENTEVVPTDLAEVARRLRRGRRPPTSVVTLIFLLTQQNSEASSLHFSAPYDIHSLFFPQASLPISAKQRAEAFLWLIYHYLEGPAATVPGEYGSNNPFDDASSIATRKRAREAWASEGSVALNETNPFWRGIPNPAYRQWKETYEKGNSEEEKRKARQRAELTDPCPEIYTDRVLIPALTPISYEALKAEDADTQEEIDWGKQMQQERAAFLVRFQEEEQAKVIANGGTVGDDAPVDEAKPKRRIPSGTQSCYPLANILANAAVSGSSQGAMARSPIGFVKRARLSSRNSHKDSRESSLAPTEEVETEHRKEVVNDTPGVWELELEKPSAGDHKSLLDETWKNIQGKSAGEASSDQVYETFSNASIARILLIHKQVYESLQSE